MPKIADTYAKVKLTGYTRGIRGHRGPQGPQGEQGIQGPQGYRGPKGLIGEVGLSPAFSIGTVEIDDTATITTTGTDESPILNMTIPKGEKGDTGESPIVTLTKEDKTSTMEVELEGETNTYEFVDGEHQYEAGDGITIENNVVTNTTHAEIYDEGTAEKTIPNEINDALGGVIETEEIKGNTTQDGTPTPTAPVPINVVSGRQDIVVAGKNLLNEDEIVVGFLGTNGQWSPSVTSWSTTPYIPIEASTTYSFSFTPITTGTYWQTRVVYYDNTMAYVSGTDLSSYPSNYTYSITTPQNVSYMRISFTNTGNYQRKEFQLEKGTKTSYEAYKGNTYEINLGKNELQPLRASGYTTTFNGITYTWQDDGSIRVQGTATANSNTQIGNNNTPGLRELLLSGEYFLSGAPSGASSTTYRLQLYGYNANGGGFIYADNGVKITTFVNETKAFNIAIWVANGQTVDLVFRPQLEKGDQATTYAPYKTPIELCKIGNYQDRIYKNGNKWYLEKKIGKVIIDGTTGTFSNPSTNRYNIDNLITDYRKVTGNPDTLSNYYQGYAQTANNASFNSLVSNVSYGFNLSSSANTIRFKNTDISSTNDFKTWLGTHNTTVYYILATPTYTEITDTELISQLESIELLEGLNNVSVVSPYLPATIRLEYYLDNVNGKLGAIEKMAELLERM